MSRQLIAVLDDFVKNVYQVESLIDAQAKKNLEEGVIELVWKSGQHGGNGLLITDDGYFLTARHCTGPFLPQVDIAFYDGTKCKIEKVCAQGKTDFMDLALVKADVPGSQISRSYRFQNSEYIEASLPIALFTRWNGQLVKKYGFTRPALSSWKDMFTSSIPAVKGDSGGIVADKNYALMGILSLVIGSIDETQQIKRYDLYSTFSMSMPKALKLIDFYKRCLESRL